MASAHEYVLGYINAGSMDTLGRDEHVKAVVKLLESDISIDELVEVMGEFLVSQDAVSRKLAVRMLAEVRLRHIFSD